MRPAAPLIALKPALTAIIAGGLAGLIAILTFQLMMGAQHLIWETGAPAEGPGPVTVLEFSRSCRSAGRGPTVRSSS